MSDPKAEQYMQMTGQIMADREVLAEELERLIKYAVWQMDEGGRYHPTLSSAVEAAAEALTRVRGKGE
jgi:hypothetical protein